jgi:hypothetical protein
MGAPVGWFDITTSDPKRIGAFYTELFRLDAQSERHGRLLAHRHGRRRRRDRGRDRRGPGPGRCRRHDDLSAGRRPSGLSRSGGRPGRQRAPAADTAPGDYEFLRHAADPDGRAVGLMG